MTILGVIGHILLILLKILLILLAVILLLVLIVLILPIRYEAAARGDSRKGLPGVYAQARVGVLLGLISLRVMLKEGSLVYTAKILRFSLKKGRTRLYGDETGEEETETVSASETREETVNESGSPAEEKETTSEESGTPAESGTSGESGTPAERGTSAESGKTAESCPGADGEGGEAGTSVEDAKSEDDDAGEPVDPADAGTGDAEERNPERESSDASSGAEEKPPWRPRPIMERILDLTDAVGGLLDGKGVSSRAGGAVDRVQGIGDKILAAGDKAAWVMDQAQEPSVVRTVQRVKRALFRILRAYLPREIRMDGEFGTGDPASTGQALGWIYTFYPMYCEKGDIRVAGNFEETMIRGKLYLKGHIRLIVAVGSALLLLPDRNIRKLIKKLIFGGGKHGTE